MSLQNWKGNVTEAKRMMWWVKTKKKKKRRLNLSFRDNSSPGMGQKTNYKGLKKL